MKEFRKDRLKILILGLIIGISIGICVGFLWGAAAINDMIRTGSTQIPQRMSAIPF